MSDPAPDDLPTTPVSAAIEIDAPPSVVFAIVADPRQHARIDGSGTVLGDRVEGPERLSLGAQFGMDMKLGARYRTRNTVVEFEEDRLIAWRHQGRHRWRYRLEPLPGDRTRVTEEWDDSRYPAPGRWILRAIGYHGRNQAAVEATLVRLRDAAEADAAGTGTETGGGAA